MFVRTRHFRVLASCGEAPGPLARKMTAGSNAMRYNLYTNTARTTIWGDGTAGTAKVSDSMTLLVGTTVRSYTIYGRINALQDLSPGTYSDKITVTLNYN